MCRTPHVELMEKHQGKLDVGAAVGSTGTLTVIKDIGLKEPYVGSIGLFSGEIADDLAACTLPRASRSPTACALGVLVGTRPERSASAGRLPHPAAARMRQRRPHRPARGAVSAPRAPSRPRPPRADWTPEGHAAPRSSDGFQLEIPREARRWSYRCYCSRDRVTSTPSSAIGPRGPRPPSSADQGQAHQSRPASSAIRSIPSLCRRRSSDLLKEI